MTWHANLEYRYFQFQLFYLLFKSVLRWAFLKQLSFYNCRRWQTAILLFKLFANNYLIIASCLRFQKGGKPTSSVYSMTPQAQTSTSFPYPSHSSLSTIPDLHKRDTVQHIYVGAKQWGGSGHPPCSRLYWIRMQEANTVLPKVSQKSAENLNLKNNIFYLNFIYFFLEN